jgi:protein O-mannosyl-transferase
VVAHYLWLAIWPHRLVFDYGDTITIRHITEAAPCALILAVLGAGVLLELRRQSPIGFVGAWFFIILAPASSVVPVVGQPMAEHRMYLSLAAVVTMGVMGINAWMGRRSVPVFLALALGLGFLTIRRNQAYRTELSIWNDTLAKCPNNARAHSNRGFALEQAGRRQEAIVEYQQALQIKPDTFEAQLNLGYALCQMGRWQEAIGHYQEALRIRPDNAKAHYNLGLALWRTGQLPGAIDHYEQALRIAPDFAEAHVVLGIALAQAGSNQDALVQFRESVRLRPDYTEAHFDLGLALEKLGRTREAIEQFKQALKLRPDFAPARNALARLLVGS